MDCVALRGIEIHAFHGLHDFEKKEGNTFIIDAFFWADISLAGKTDDVSHTVDYSIAFQIITEVMHGSPKNLMESLLEEMKTRLTIALPMVTTLELRIKKQAPPLPGTCAASEIRRTWQIA